MKTSDNGGLFGTLLFFLKTLHFVFIDVLFSMFLQSFSEVTLLLFIRSSRKQENYTVSEERS